MNNNSVLYKYLIYRSIFSLLFTFKERRKAKPIKLAKAHNDIKLSFAFRKGYIL